MAKGYKVCKVCGKTYEYCTTERRIDMFRWQDIACCPEHGAIYFEKVMAARSGKPAEAVTPATQDAPKKKSTRKKKAEPVEPVVEKEMA